MARGKLWSVKGVTGEAREAAKTAAQKSGQPIGVWIDQAIRMSDDDGLPPKRDPAQNAGGGSNTDIVAILQALEARVADHADRISEQLAPVRTSIAELANRLDEIENAASTSGNMPTPSPVTPATAPERQEAQAPEQKFSPDPTPEPTPEPDPAPDTAPSSLNLRPADMAGTHLPPELSEETVRNDTPPPHDPKPASMATPPENTSADATEPAQPKNITEEDIHAADAALKSELTGLFDDGAHRDAAQQRMGPTPDPFLPPRPPRPTSRAPLVFVVVILLAVCAGIAAVAWFEFLSPEARQDLTSQLTSIAEQGTGSADPASKGNAPAGEAAPLSTTPVTTPTESAESASPSAIAPDEPVVAAAPTPNPDPSTAVPEVPTPQVAAPPANEPEPVADAEPETSPETVAETVRPPPPAPSPVPNPVQADTTPPAETAAADTVPPNPELEVLRREAATGSASAQNDLGVRYLVGRGVAQDFTVAADWLRKAAAQDMTNAQYNLGVLYDSGRGVEPDPTEALIWFHTAAEKGHGRAQMAVAAAYASGRGIERNPDEALRWLRRAAESNIGEAQFSLANILATSPSSQESLIDAYVWYRIADANGIAQASERAEQVAARLTPEERAGANARISHFLGRNLPKPNLRPSSATSSPTSPTPAASATSPASPKPSPSVASATPEPSEPAAITSAEIEEIQTLLARLGFSPGVADGRTGQKTTEAIRNYQTELGLAVDGEPSEYLLRHLRQIAGVR